MDDFDQLRALFRDDAVAPPQRPAGQSRRVTLEECGNTQYTLDVTGIPDEAIAFKADKFPSPGPVFRDSRHECKRADYVIFARRRQRRWIVYLEMKKKKGKRPEIVCQLKGAKCVVSYCRAIIREFWGDHPFLQGYAERFVSVGDIGLNKQPTRRRQTPVHNKPENMLRLSAPNGVVRFAKLLK